MIYPDCTLEEWLKKYPELEIMEKSCIDCGNRLRSTIPYITKEYVGIVSGICSCGSIRSTCDCSMTRTKEEHQNWLKL